MREGNTRGLKKTFSALSESKKRKKNIFMDVPVPLRQALPLPSHVSLTSDTFKRSLGNTTGAGAHNSGVIRGDQRVLEHVGTLDV